jgi:3-deoxy-D-manno-octulosonic-acid transferase
MKLLYNLGIHVYGFLIFLASLFNSKAKKRLIGQRQAFTFFNEKIKDEPGVEYIWFHAASLGEFEQGRPVMEAVRKNYPGYKILLTFFSPSGYEVRKNYIGADLVGYLPLDTYLNAEKFINLIKPAKAIFIKYEFWPNFLSCCKKYNIPTYVISANFRKDQLFFKWYGKKYAEILKSFECIFVQDENSKLLLEDIAVTRVKVAGDTRFDRVVDIASARKDLPIVEAFRNGQKLIIAGSSWPKDEDLLIRYLQENKKIKLVLAPHEIDESHIQEIESKLNTSVVRYSNATGNNVSAVSCLIIDNFGLLSSIYQYADITYVGGGFGVGIHNVLEAAVYGKPVIFGVNYKRFREACDLIAYGGAFSVEDYMQLKSRFDWLLLDETAGKRSSEYVLKNVGATKKIVDAIFAQN